MKRTLILFVIAILILSYSVCADIFIPGPTWYNETCNGAAYGNIKEISVSGNYVGVATECNCDLNMLKNCNGLFIFNVNFSNASNTPEPYVFSANPNEWFESIQVDGSRLVTGSSFNYIYYFYINEYGNWQKKWDKNLGSTVVSAYVSGDYVTAGSGDYVYLFDADGNEKWKYAADSKVLVVSIADEKVIAGTENGFVYIFDFTGDNKIEYKTDAQIESIYAADELIAVGSDQIYVFSTDGTLEWKSGTHGTIKSVHFADGTLAAGSLSNRIYSYALNGTKNVEYLTDSPIWAVHAAGDFIAAGATDGTTYLIGTDGKFKWKYTTDKVGSIKSAGFCSIYNTEIYVVAGGWGKNIYLFDSGKAIAEDEIDKAEELINAVKEVMNVTGEEKIIKEAKSEIKSGNYVRSMELSRSVEPAIIEDVYVIIAEEERIMDAIEKTADIRKYGALSNVLRQAGIELEEAKSSVEIEEAKKLILKEKYVESVKRAKETKESVDAEIEKIIESVERAIDEVEDIDNEEIELILSQKPEFKVMSHEEKEKELELIDRERVTDINFSIARDDIEKARAAFEESDYENAIRYSDKAVKGVELKINDIIKDVEKEVTEIEGKTLVFKVDASSAREDIDEAKKRLQYERCGVTFEGNEVCPQYASAILWAEHGRGTANKDESITVAQNIAVGILILGVSIFVFQHFRKKREADELEEEIEEEIEEETVEEESR